MSLALFYIPLKAKSIMDGSSDGQLILMAMTILMIMIMMLVSPWLETFSWWWAGTDRFFYFFKNILSIFIHVLLLANHYNALQRKRRIKINSVLKLIVIHFVEIQNLVRYWWPVANCPTRPRRWKAGSIAHATVLPSDCWGKRVDWMQPTESPLFKKFAGDNWP